VANAGDKILVSRGVYEESVTITIPIILEGSGNDTVLLPSSEAGKDSAGNALWVGIDIRVPAKVRRLNVKFGDSPNATCVWALERAVNYEYKAGSRVPTTDNTTQACAASCQQSAAAGGATYCRTWTFNPSTATCTLGVDGPNAAMSVQQPMTGSVVVGRCLSHTMRDVGVYVRSTAGGSLIHEMVFRRAYGDEPTTPGSRAFLVESAPNSALERNAILGGFQDSIHVTSSATRISNNMIQSTNRVGIVVGVENATAADVDIHNVVDGNIVYGGIQVQSNNNIIQENILVSVDKIVLCGPGANCFPPAGNVATKQNNIRDNQGPDGSRFSLVDNFGSDNVIAPSVYCGARDTTKDRPCVANATRDDQQVCRCVSGYTCATSGFCMGADANAPSLAPNSPQSPAGPQSPFGTVGPTTAPGVIIPGKKSSAATQFAPLLLTGMLALSVLLTHL
jgi:hypothetical protein